MTGPATRRGFLKGAGALAMGWVGGCKSIDRARQKPAGVQRYPIAADVIGVQLYTVRALFEAKPAATLRALAEIGIKDCETAGLFDHRPADIRAMLDDLGLASRSAHVRLPQLRNGLDFDLEAAAILGQDALFLAWLPEEERAADRYRALADLLNERGEKTRKAGIRLGYHNHDFEFEDLGGTTGYRILLERTDPALVDLEIDFFWATMGGADPVSLFEAAPGRFTSCHLKDRDAAGKMASVGSGTIDFKRIMSHAEIAGLKRFYIEHDDPSDPLASIARSYAHLFG